MPLQIDLKLFLTFLCQKKGSKSRLAKSHDFVASLTILGPISRSNDLATDFSHFLEKSNSEKKGAVSFFSKLGINREIAQPKENGNTMYANAAVFV